MHPVKTQISLCIQAISVYADCMKKPLQPCLSNKHSLKLQGPVIQSILSLMSLTTSLTVVAIFENIDIFAH